MSQPEAPADDGPEASAALGADAPVLVAQDHGACPMCGEAFDDPAEFGAHLADEHDLHDDEGTATGFGELEVVPVGPGTPLGPAIPELASPERRYRPPERGRPIGLVLVVLLLLGLLGGLVALTDGADEEDTAAEIDTVQTTEVDVPSTTEPAAPTERAPTGTVETTVPSAAAPPTGSPASSPPTTAGTRASSATPPTTSPEPPPTTAPPSGYVAPLATGARVESCDRVRGDWHVTYRWTFTGGARWVADPGYRALGGGLYQHTVTVPGRKDVAITTVRVTDVDGQVHGVALQPSLSTASC